MNDVQVNSEQKPRICSFFVDGYGNLDDETYAYTATEMQIHLGKNEAPFIL